MWIYLCDDDPVDRFRTEYFLKQYAARRSFRVQIQTFLSAAELLQAFQTAAEPPFLILLDILMSSLDGMAAAEALCLPLPPRNMPWKAIRFMRMVFWPNHLPTMILCLP